MLRGVKSLLLMLCLFFAGFGHGQETPVRIPVKASDVDAALESKWFGVYFQGKKIGYVNSERSREGKGEKAFYRESFRVSIKLLSFGQKAEITSSEVVDFDGQAPFAIRGGHAERNDGKTK